MAELCLTDFQHPGWNLCGGDIVPLLPWACVPQWFHKMFCIKVHNPYNYGSWILSWSQQKNDKHSHLSDLKNGFAEEGLFRTNQNPTITALAGFRHKKNQTGEHKWWPPLLFQNGRMFSHGKKRVKTRRFFISLLLNVQFLPVSSTPSIWLIKASLDSDGHKIRQLMRCDVEIYLSSQALTFHI